MSTPKVFIILQKRWREAGEMLENGVAEPEQAAFEECGSNHTIKRSAITRYFH